MPTLEEAERHGEYSGGGGRRGEEGVREGQIGFPGLTDRIMFSFLILLCPVLRTAAGFLLVLDLPNQINSSPNSS